MTVNAVSVAPFICEPHGNPVDISKPFTLDMCHRCYLGAGGKIDKGRRVVGPPASASASATPCPMLGERLEYRAGCGGRMCLHACNSTDPKVSEHLGGIMKAVPGDDCLTCPAKPNRQSAATATKTITFDMGGSGIGDGLQGLLAVNGYKSIHPDVRITYRVGTTAMPFVELFHGYDILARHFKPHWEHAAPGAVQLNLGYKAEWAAKFAGGGRWERYCRNAGDGVKPAIPELKEPEKIRAFGADYAGRVVLCPFSHGKDREWPLRHWLDLERKLIADGWKTIVMHSSAQEPGRSLREFQGLLAVGLPPERVAGIMLNSRLVIGNDSGMAHLSGILGVPTLVVMSGQPGDRVFGCYPKVKLIQG